MDTDLNTIVEHPLPSIRTGTDDFKTLLLNSDVFVDKSLMVQALLEDSGEVVLITRPRRWGKSLNMDMLRKFFEIEVDQEGRPLPEEDKVNNKLFIGGVIDLKLATGRKKILQPLQIAHHLDIIQDYQGQFPVISINFKDIKGSSYEEIESGIRNQVIKLFAAHYYLRYHIAKDTIPLDKAQKEKLSRYFDGTFTKADLKDSLGFLSALLYEHFGRKVYILIDEYDTPINSSYIKFGNKPEEFEQVLELFRGILGSSLKSNPYLEKGVITGILRVAKANLFSDLNNVGEYTLLDTKFAKFYGFTQGEVDELLVKVPTEIEPQAIKDWYNGYTFGGELIYNPWSIMLCLASNGQLGHYWLDSGGTSLIDKVLLSDEIQEDMQELLAGRGIIKKLYRQVSLEGLENHKDIFYSLLVFAGYLNPLLANDNPESPRYCLTIPNKEVRELYVERVMGWVAKKLNMDTSSYDKFIGLLINRQIDKFGESLGHYLLHSTSYYDLSQERDYHNLMGGLLAPLVSQYMIASNREAGHGRCDHILTPIAGCGDNAIIIGYKVSKSAENLKSVASAGLAQIKRKQYDAKIRADKHVKHITQISLVFYGKQVALQFQIDHTLHL